MKILNDFNTNVKRALNEIDPIWESYTGLIVCGSHATGTEKAEEIIAEIKEARESSIPVLGICFGMQMMIVEYCRKLGVKNASTEEIDPKNAVIVKMKNLRVGLRYSTSWRGASYETHWHNYKASFGVNELIENDFHLYVVDDQTQNDIILQAIKHREHPFYAGVQFHPEYQSIIDQPHEILVEFLEACKKYE